MSEDNWKHRKQGMRCSTCMWWVRKGGSVLGRCRALPPGAGGSPGWQPTFETDWCRSHRLDEDAVSAQEPK